MQRPESLIALTNNIEALGVMGEAPAKDLPAIWLASIGVSSSAGEYLVAHEEWVRGTLPVRNSKDLLRLVAFRDPLYRYYLDTLLAQVLQGMAAANYLEKVEQLLETSLYGFAPRLTYVLRDIEIYSLENVLKLTGRQWEAYRSAHLGEDELMKFVTWNQELFGQVPGGPEQIFPLLMEHYGPWVASPVYVGEANCDLSREALLLLAALVMAAGEGEGLYAAAEQTAALQELISYGIPIRQWGSSQRDGYKWGIINPIVLYTDAEYREGKPVTSAIPELAAYRQLVTSSQLKQQPSSLRPIATGFWSTVEDKKRVGAYPGLTHELDSVLTIADITANKLTDEKILELANHPGYGLWLQILLAKSLEAGIGDDCIMIINDQFYYVPRKRVGEEDTTKVTRQVGSITDIMNRIAEAVSIYGVPAVYTSQTDGWNQMLGRMRAAEGILVNQQETKEIVLASDFFMNCHNWTLMPAVIRRGHQVRETIHQVLRQCWQDAARIERNRDAK